MIPLFLSSTPVIFTHISKKAYSQFWSNYINNGMQLDFFILCMLFNSEVQR